MRRLMVSIGVIALVASACGGSDTVAEQIAEQASGVDNVEISDDSVAIEFETEEGQASAVIGGGEVPDGAPMPIPDGGDVQSSVSAAGNASVTISYPGDRFDELVSLYEEWAAAATWDNLSESSNTEPAIRGWSGQMGDSFVVVSITMGFDDDAVVSLVWGDQ